jgi:hypothetical protein
MEGSDLESVPVFGGGSSAEISTSGKVGVKTSVMLA